MKTTVINLFAGSGAGKSTTAAALFAAMKQEGYDVELVREYVKNWAYEGRKIEHTDQIYLLAKQMKAELPLYGKVKYLVTDSPFLLSGFYSELYYGKTYITDTANNVMADTAEKANRINVFINRNKPFVEKGRYETEEQAKANDVAMKEFLKENNYDFIEIGTPKGDEINDLLQKVTLYTGGTL